MIKAIIFDCFGVIISDALQVIVNELRARDPGAAANVADLVRASNRGMIDPVSSNRQIAELFKLEFGEYQAKIREGEVRDQRVLDYAKELRISYKTAILSNISGTGLQKRFTDEEIEGCFDIVVASGEIGYAKPDAKAYEITAERLGVAIEECVFTDDRVDFCDAAKRTGMQAIEYRSFEQFKTELENLLQQP